MKVGVRSVKDQKKLELVTTHLGEDFFLESVPGVFRLVDWDAGRRTWEFDWTRTNWGAVAVRNGEDLPGTGLELVLVAVRDFPGDRTLAASVEVVKGGEVLPRSEISPNHPLSVDGVELHLTADGVDPTGAPFVGIQAVSDPFAGAALWMGALFLLGSSGAILLKEREARG